jgi:hypothetical protein
MLWSDLKFAVRGLIGAYVLGRTPRPVSAYAKGTARPRRSAYGAKAGARGGPIAPLRSPGSLARLARVRNLREAF